MIAGDRALITALMPLRNVGARFPVPRWIPLAAQTSNDWRLLIIVEREDRDRFEELLKTSLPIHAPALL